MITLLNGKLYSDKHCQPNKVFERFVMLSSIEKQIICQLNERRKGETFFHTLPFFELPF